MILGVDISSHQKNIDFKKMKSAGVQFVYIRAGLGFNKDIRYEQNKIGAKEAGIPWGSYWVPLATQYSQLLLDTYFEMIDGDWGNLPPALDVETKGLGLGIFKMWIDQTEPKWHATLSKLAPLVRKKLLLYTRASHFNEYSDTKNLKAYIGLHTNLWVAHYTYDPINKPPTISTDTWNNYIIHQYSADENKLGSTYGVSSVAIDMDYFNDKDFSFADWSGVNESIPEIPDTPEPPESDNCIEILVDQLWGRSAPIYESRTHSVITRKGEVYEKAGEPKYEEGSGITWQPIRIPERICYVSADEKYIKEAL